MGWRQLTEQETVLVWAQWLWTETLRTLVPFPPFYCLHMVSSSCRLLFLNFPPSELLMLASIYVPKTESGLHQSISGFLYCFLFSTPGSGGGVQENKTNKHSSLYMMGPPRLQEEFVIPGLEGSLWALSLLTPFQQCSVMFPQLSLKALR